VRKAALVVNAVRICQVSEHVTEHGVLESLRFDLLPIIGIFVFARAKFPYCGDGPNDVKWYKREPRLARIGFDVLILFVHA
jgi:hypothetical protein